MVLAEAVGPYTIGLTVVVLVGLPIMAHFMRRSLRLQAGPLSAELSGVREVIEAAHQVAVETKEVVLETAVAVNNVDHDEPKLIDQVRTLRSDLSEMRSEVAQLAVLVGNTQRSQRMVTMGLSEVTMLEERNGGRIEDTARLVREHIAHHEAADAEDEAGRRGDINRRE